MEKSRIHFPNSLYNQTALSFGQPEISENFTTPDSMNSGSFLHLMHVLHMKNLPNISWKKKNKVDCFKMFACCPCIK